MRRLFGVFCIAMTVAPSCTESKKDSAEAPATEGGGTGQTITVTGTVNLGAMEDDDAAVSLGAREVAIADAEGKTVAKSVTEPDGSYVVSMPGQLAIEPAAELALTEKRLTVRAVIADTPSETVFGVDDPIDLASGNFVQMGSQPMRKITAVRGRLLLDGARDHTGILVYVPGTHLQARTDSAGLFLLPFIPAGSYELRAERDGYLPKDLPGVEVADGETTKIAAAVLKLSGGTATFSVKQVGAEGLSPSRDVEFLITAGEADRFKAGLAAEVGNIAYGHVPEVYRHTFDADGEYDLAFVFANSDGFESTVTRRVIVDTEKPSPVGLRLADRDTLNVESSNERAVIPLHQTCADIASVAILVGAAAPRDDDFTWSCHTGGADSASSFTVPEGASTFAYTLWVRDRVGNVSAAGQAGSITIDMTPPAPRVITLNDQTSGSELGTDITTVYATVGSCVDTAKVLISESQLLPPLPAQFTTACTTAPNAFTYTFANNIAGVKTVLVWALDPAGNVGQVSGSASMTLDQTALDVPPVVTLADPTFPTTGYTNDRTIDVVLADCDDVTHVLISETKTTKPSESDPEWEACDESGQTYTLVGAEGPLAVHVWTRDIGGNVSNTKRTQAIVLDESRPNIGGFSVAFADSTGGSLLATNSSTVDVSVSPCNADAVKVYIGESATPPTAGQFVVDCDGGSLSTSYTLQNTNEGAHSLYLWVLDVAGNVSAAPHTSSILLDTQSPGLPAAFVVEDADFGSSQFTNSTTLDYTITSCTGIDYILLAEGQVTAPTESDDGWTACAAAGTVADLIASSAGSHVVYLWTKDEAGNVSASSRSHSIDWDASAPATPTSTVPGDWQTLHTQANPDTLSGTAEANATVVITDASNSTTYTAAVDGAGNWSKSVALSDNTQIYLTLETRDAAGNTSGSVGIYARHDTVPPAISGVTVALTDTTATISWQTTGELADKYLEWGPSLAYGTVVQDGASFSGSQSVSLSSLTANTEYFFRIKSTDKAGNYTAANDYTGSFRTYIPKTGTIASSESWVATDTSYYVTSVLTINASQVLTIGPGVTVKLASGASIVVNGGIEALGTVGSPITFKANATTTSPYWNTISFTATSNATSVTGATYNSGNIFRHVTFENGGSSNPMIQVTSSGLLLDHASVRYSGTSSAQIVNFTGNSNIYVWDSNFYSPAQDTLYCSSGTGGALQFIRSRYENTATSGYKTAVYLSGCAPATMTITDSYFEGYNGYNSSNGRAALLSYSTTTVWTISGNTFNGTGSSDHAVYLGGRGTFSRNLLLRHTDLPAVRIGCDVAGATCNITENVFDQGYPCVTLDMNNGTATANVTYNSFHRCTSYAWSPSDTWDSGPALGVNIYRDPVTGADVNINYNLFRGLSGYSANQSIINLYDKAGQKLDYVVNGNNFVDNTLTYYIYNRLELGDGAANVQNNWWGTADTGVIDGLIFDYSEDLTRSAVNYTGYLSAPGPDAPISPPTAFSVTDNGGGSVDLNWDATDESDSAGYIVYYDTNSGYPYGGVGALQGDSGSIVINDKDTLTFTLTGLTANTTYYFTVTAIDASRDGTADQFEGHESWYAAEVAQYLAP